MAARATIPPEVIAEAEEKKGQIAHLDRDASNSVRENLVLLCFEPLRRSVVTPSPDGAAGLARGGVGHFGAGAAGQALPAHRRRPRAARARDGDLAAIRGGGVEGAARATRRSLRSPLWRVPLAREVDEELALHLELLTRAFPGSRLAGRWPWRDVA